MTEPVQLKTRVLEGNSDGPHLLIIGGVHGDEYEPMVAIRRLMNEVDPAQLCGRVTFVPVVNEEAFARGERTAEDGLDLARICPGRADGSISERIAHAVSELIIDADYLIDLHTGGNVYVVAPLVGYAMHSDPEVLEKQRAMAQAFNLPFIWGTAGDLPGRTLSVARDHDKPALYAEWMGAGLCQPEGVEAYVDGCLNVMAQLGMIEREIPHSRVERVVEDTRTGSGQLQIHHPSPIFGLFESAVSLHQEVSKGDVLGEVSDILGDERHQIVAQQSGTVICLRVFPRVDKGDGLAVILDKELYS